MGIDEINWPVVAASDWIKIFSPEPEEQVDGTFKLTGIANVHEGTVNYQLITKTGDEVLSGFSTAAMLDWGYFEEEIEIPKGLSDTDFYLEVYSISMKDGSKMFKVTIPISAQ